MSGFVITRARLTPAMCGEISRAYVFAGRKSRGQSCDGRDSYIGEREETNSGEGVRGELSFREGNHGEPNFREGERDELSFREDEQNELSLYEREHGEPNFRVGERDEQNSREGEHEGPIFRERERDGSNSGERKDDVRNSCERERDVPRRRVEGTVHSVFTRTVNLMFGGRLLTVADESLPDMPDTVYIRESDMRIFAGAAKEGDRACFGGEGVLKLNLVFPPDQLPLTPMTPFSFFPDSVGYVRRLLRACEEVLRRRVGGESTDDKCVTRGEGARMAVNRSGFARLPENSKRQIIAALRAYTDSLIRGKCDDDAIEDIFGLGFGSTPSADDMILGISAMFSRNRPPFREDLLSRTTDISAKFLRAAGEGFYSEPLIRLITKPGKETAGRVAVSGGFSGTDTLTGIRAACRYILRRGRVNSAR